MYNDGIIECALWSYKVSKGLSAKYSDVLFWDATHDVTPYDYKLCSFTFVDSEGCSRAILFFLTLHQTGEIFQRMIQGWHDAFKTRSPRVIFTDGDEAIASAINSVDYSSDIIQLLCTFHIFDINIMEKLQKLTSIKSSEWVSFREKLKYLREIPSIRIFEGMWYLMLQKWFPKGKKYEETRKYLQNHIYSKRKQWAICFLISVAS